MGLFISEERNYDPSVRQVGFNRYRQLLSLCAGAWWKAGTLTLLGCLPLAAGIFVAIESSSLLVLLPCSLAGGMIAGPFLAGLYDAILRGMRDDLGSWRKAYARAWKQNWKGSLLPGALTGLLAGLYAFMGMLLFWWAEVRPTPGTVVMYLASLFLVLVFSSLYWPQLVLFEQSDALRLRNCLLFCIRYFWRVTGAGLLQLAFLAVFVLFAPWTLLLLPVIGVWYILFVAQFLLYRQLDDAFHIEELFHPTPQNGAAM